MISKETFNKNVPIFQIRLSGLRVEKKLFISRAITHCSLLTAFCLVDNDLEMHVSQSWLGYMFGNFKCSGKPTLYTIAIIRVFVF